MSEYRFAVAARPFGKRGKRLNQSFAERCEFIFHAHRHFGVHGSAGDGRFASAAIADYAAAAVAVLTGTGQEGKIYELAGDAPYTMTEMAAEVAKQSGKPVAYNNLPPEGYQNALVGLGIPAFMAEYLVDAEVGAANGELDDTSGELHALIGRPTATLAEAVAAAL